MSDPVVPTWPTINRSVVGGIALSSDAAPRASKVVWENSRTIMMIMMRGKNNLINHDLFSPPSRLVSVLALEDLNVRCIRWDLTR
jgi:hypothetical protein